MERRERECVFRVMSESPFIGKVCKGAYGARWNI